MFHPQFIFSVKLDIGRIVLKKLEQILKEKLNKNGLPIHYQMMVNRERGRAMEVCIEMEISAIRVAEGAQVTVNDKLGKLEKTGGESKLMFARRTQFFIPKI